MSVDSDDMYEAPTQPPGEAARAEDVLDPLVGEQVGPFRVKRLLASGGMGRVYTAVQSTPRRTVALKVMREGIASASALRRFEYEAQLLARLQHPGIAQIYEAGTWEHGGQRIPYFAMEYVAKARPLTVFARERGLSTLEQVRALNLVDHLTGLR